MTMQPQQTPPGWYPQGNVQRYWDGQQWTDHVSPMQAAAAPPQVVVQAGPGRSVTKTKKSTSHTFHLIMTIITGGIWGVFVWLPIVIWHSIGPKAKSTTKHY